MIKIEVDWAEVFRRFDAFLDFAWLVLVPMGLLTLLIVYVWIVMS